MKKVLQKSKGCSGVLPRGRKADGLAQLAAEDMPCETGQVLTLLHAAWYALLIQGKRRSSRVQVFSWQLTSAPKRALVSWLHKECASPALLCTCGLERLDHPCFPALLHPALPGQQQRWVFRRSSGEHYHRS